jgi:hypothetical protein
MAYAVATLSGNAHPTLNEKKSVILNEVKDPCDLSPATSLRDFPLH